MPTNTDRGSIGLDGIIRAGTATFEVQRVITLNGTSSNFKDMLANRNNNVTTLFRKCSEAEAMRTYMYLLAGGIFVNLTQPKPTETQAVEQVANNESFVRRAGQVDRRLEVLQALKKQKTGPDTSKVTVYEHVVEYSLGRSALGQAFSGVWLEIGINRNFLVVGSRLVTEQGWIAMRGAPLSYAKVDQLSYKSMPLPPTRDDNVLR